MGIEEIKDNKKMRVTKSTIALITSLIALFGSGLTIFHVRDYIDTYYNQPNINIQFSQSHESIILIKESMPSLNTEQFRLALEIKNNSYKTYNNIECEFVNLSKKETSYYSSIIEFSIDELNTVNNQKSADKLKMKK